MNEALSVRQQHTKEYNNAHLTLIRMKSHKQQAHSQTRQQEQRQEQARAKKHRREQRQAHEQRLEQAKAKAKAQEQAKAHVFQMAQQQTQAQQPAQAQAKAQAQTHEQAHAKTGREEMMAGALRRMQCDASTGTTWRLARRGGVLRSTSRLVSRVSRLSNRLRRGHRQRHRLRRGQRQRQMLHSRFSISNSKGKCYTCSNSNSNRHMLHSRFSNSNRKGKGKCYTCSNSNSNRHMLGLMHSDRRRQQRQRLRHRLGLSRRHRRPHVYAEALEFAATIRLLICLNCRYRIMRHQEKGRFTCLDGIWIKNRNLKTYRVAIFRTQSISMITDEMIQYR